MPNGFRENYFVKQFVLRSTFSATRHTLLARTHFVAMKLLIKWWIFYGAAYCISFKRRIRNVSILFYFSTPPFSLDKLLLLWQLIILFCSFCVLPPSPPLIIPFKIWSMQNWNNDLLCISYLKTNSVLVLGQISIQRKRKNEMKLINQFGIRRKKSFKCVESPDFVNLTSNCCTFHFRWHLPMCVLQILRYSTETIRNIHEF